jgi:hypothetical protein
MNKRQLVVAWLTGISIILVITICSYDYRNFWIGVYSLWIILVIGGLLLYILKDREKMTVEKYVKTYSTMSRIKAVLRIIADILLLSLPIFIVKFLIKDIKNSIKKMKGE